MGKQNSASIDISLDGVGGNSMGGRAPAGGGSPIDIPLDGPRTPRGGTLGAGNITDAELEIVNRHHAEIMELHRRAREQNG